MASRHSSYWLKMVDAVTYDMVDTPTMSLIVAVKLAGIRRAISNYVRILTGDDTIQVRFAEEGDSRSDGKRVMIAASIASRTLDSTVGLALHEASHCKYTPFEKWGILLDLARRPHHPIHANIFHPRVASALRSAGPGERAELLELFHDLLNIVEDRRIDALTYAAAPGYRPYFVAMHEKYVLTEEISASLRRGEHAEPTFENYLVQLLSITNPFFNPDILPGLREMVARIDLPTMASHTNITNQYLERLLGSVEDREMRRDYLIDTKILPDATAVSQRTLSYDQVDPMWHMANDLMAKILDQVLSFFFSYSPTPRISKTYTALYEMVAHGEVMRQTKTRERTIRRAYDLADVAMTVSHVESMNLSVPVLFVERLSMALLESEWFGFLDPSARGPDISTGIQMGNILARRLQVRRAPSHTVHKRLPVGKVDRRMLYQLGAGNENIFKKTQTDRHRAVMLHISLDASGSMGGAKWTQAMNLVAALIVLGDKVSHIDVVVSLRGTTMTGNAIVTILHDSRVSHLTTFRKYVPFLRPTGTTPEGLCLAPLLERLDSRSDAELFFVNIGDGIAAFHHTTSAEQSINYRGDLAIRHTRHVVDQYRSRGIRVLSYFVNGTGPHHRRGSDRTWIVFSQVYGESARRVDVQNVLSILRTLEELLVSEDSVIRTLT